MSYPYWQIVVIAPFQHHEHSQSCCHGTCILNSITNACHKQACVTPLSEHFMPTCTHSFVTIVIVFSCHCYKCNFRWRSVSKYIVLHIYCILYVYHLNDCLCHVLLAIRHKLSINVCILFHLVTLSLSLSLSVCVSVCMRERVCEGECVCVWVCVCECVCVCVCMYVVHPFRWRPLFIILSSEYTGDLTSLSMHGEFCCSSGRVCCQHHWRHLVTTYSII